jgi:hypothetical protein
MGLKLVLIGRHYHFSYGGYVLCLLATATPTPLATRTYSRSPPRRQALREVLALPCRRTFWTCLTRFRACFLCVCSYFLKPCLLVCACCIIYIYCEYKYKYKYKIYLWHRSNPQQAASAVGANGALSCMFRCRAHTFVP